MVVSAEDPNILGHDTPYSPVQLLFLDCLTTEDEGTTIPLKVVNSSPKRIAPHPRQFEPTPKLTSCTVINFGTINL